jgi:hypothetical protein
VPIANKLSETHHQWLRLMSKAQLSSNSFAHCKVSVCVGLRNEPRDLQMPILSINLPCVACLDPMCALMKHMMSAMPPTCTSTLPVSFALPHPCPLPPASVTSPSPRSSPHLLPFKTPWHKPCRCHVVCPPRLLTTHAYPSIPVRSCHTWRAWPLASWLSLLRAFISLDI